MISGFNPIFSQNAKKLILGSFPSVKSRENNFYYGNKLNRFWHVLEKTYNVKLQSIQDKVNCVLNNQLALWDICSSCEIKGSLDSNIKNIKYANIKQLLPPNTKVDIILCNGRKSFDLTTKYIKENNINISIKYLPSTSPANTRFDIEEWLKALK